MAYSQIQIRNFIDFCQLVENIFNRSEIFLDISEVLCTEFNAVACELTDSINL